ncbi:MAG TPA: type II toxin-antitoxin system VapC family toxin [Capsulimonadaceae bacterium]
MTTFYWDASALAKRYIPESSSDVVDFLFDGFPAADMVASVLTYAETRSVFKRALNRPSITKMAYEKAIDTLAEDWFLTPRFTLLSMDDSAILAGMTFIDMENVNASDGAILSTYVDHIAAQHVSPAALIACDRNLLRAARNTSLTVIDPLDITVAQLAQMLV